MVEVSRDRLVQKLIFYSYQLQAHLAWLRKTGQKAQVTIPASGLLTVAFVDHGPLDIRLCLISRLLKKGCE